MRVDNARTTEHSLKPAAEKKMQIIDCSGKNTIKPPAPNKKQKNGHLAEAKPPPPLNNVSHYGTLLGHKIRAPGGCFIWGIVFGGALIGGGGVTPSVALSQTNLTHSFARGDKCKQWPVLKRRREGKGVTIAGAEILLERALWKHHGAEGGWEKEKRVERGEWWTFNESERCLCVWVFDIMWFQSLA